MEVVRLRVLVVVVGFGAAFAASGCLYDSDPWNAEVVSVTSDEVCTSALEGVDDWRTEIGDVDCFATTDNYTNWDELTLVVGDCVHLNVHHPVLVIETEVDCPG